jgi:hypothetical protein
MGTTLTVTAPTCKSGGHFLGFLCFGNAEFLDVYY